MNRGGGSSYAAWGRVVKVGDGELMHWRPCALPPSASGQGVEAGALVVRGKRGRMGGKRERVPCRFEGKGGGVGNAGQGSHARLVVPELTATGGQAVGHRAGARARTQGRGKIQKAAAGLGVGERTEREREREGQREGGREAHTHTLSLSLALSLSHALGAQHPCTARAKRGERLRGGGGPREGRISPPIQREVK